MYRPLNTSANFESWAPSRANMLSITKLSLFYRPCCDCSPARSTLETMDHFPALKEVKIRLQDPEAKNWIKFLGVASGRLQRMEKFVSKIVVGRRGVQGLSRMWSGSLSTDEDMCLRAYKGPFLKKKTPLAEPKGKMGI
jgi:hypothetical protein